MVTKNDSIWILDTWKDTDLLWKCFTSPYLWLILWGGLQVHSLVIQSSLPLLPSCLLSRLFSSSSCLPRLAVKKKKKLIKKGRGICVSLSRVVPLPRGGPGPTRRDRGFSFPPVCHRDVCVSTCLRSRVSVTPAGGRSWSETCGEGVAERTSARYGVFPGVREKVLRSFVFSRFFRLDFSRPSVKTGFDSFLINMGS